MQSVVQGTEGTVATSELSPTPGTPLHGNVSIPEDAAFHQPTQPEITGEPDSIANILSSAIYTGPSEQSSRKGLLKGKAWFRFALPPALTLRLDILFEFSSPHHFNDELALAIMRGGNFETLRLTKISPTKWKAVENIDL